MNKNDDWNDIVLKKYSNQAYGNRTKTYQHLAIGNFIKKLYETIEENEKTIQKLVVEKEARPNITLDIWNNDYSKRPTQVDFDKEQNKSKKLETDINTILTKWKASNLKDLSEGIQAIVNELDTSDTAISNQTNEIKALKAKNEKLLVNNKKLYTYLGDAWKMVSHLQKDLASIKGEREQLHQDILALQVKVKDLTPNETEKQLMNYMRWKDWENKNLERIKERLETGQTSFYKWDWNQLRGDFVEIRNKLLELVNVLIEQSESKQHIQKELNDALAILNKPTAEMGTQTDLTAEQISQMEKDIETKKTELTKLVQEQKEQSEEYQKKQQEITELQTKYDMEVRSKEELVKFLNVYRSQNNYLQYNENDKVGLKEFLDQHSSKSLNFLLIRLNKSKVIDFNLVKTVMYTFCSILKISHAKHEEIVLNNLSKKYKEGIDFYQVGFSRGEHLLLCNSDKTKISYAED